MITYILTFIMVIIMMAIADICWTLYFIKIEERKSIQAGIWGSMIYLFSAITVTKYMENQSYIIAAIIGAFLGTYLTVEWKIKKDKKRKTNKQ